MLCCIGCGILRSEVAQLKAWFHPRHQLLILVSNEFLTCIFSHNAIRHHLVAMLVCLHIGILALGLEISVKARLGHDDGHLLVVIWIVCLYCHILDVWTYTECGIRRQSPWSCSPGRKIRLTPVCPFSVGIGYLEEGCTCCVLHVAIATRLVELV